MSGFQDIAQWMEDNGELVGALGMVGSAFTATIKGQQSKSDYEQKMKDIDDLIKNRQPIVDPYADVKDLSGMIRNEYADLNVATKASEFEAEEADIALANTLDTIRQMGMGSGSATSLAQEALRSKRGISANIEKQEVANSKLRAQGAMDAQKRKVAEAQRMQGIEVARQQFQYGEKEKRELMALDRAQSLADRDLAQQFQYQSDAAGAFTGAMGAFVGMGQENSTGGDDGPMVWNEETGKWEFKK